MKETISYHLLGWPSNNLTLSTIIRSKVKVFTYSEFILRKKVSERVDFQSSDDIEGIDDMVMTFEDMANLRRIYKIVRY